MIELTEDTELRCPLCNEISTALQWDTYTESKCTTRQLRRAYKSITTKGILSRTKDFYYCCPYCDKYSKANALRFVRDSVNDIESLIE